MKKILISVWTFSPAFSEVSVFKRNDTRMHAVVKLHCDLHGCEGLDDFIRSVSEAPFIFCNCAILFYKIDSLFSTILS